MTDPTTPAKTLPLHQQLDPAVESQPEDTATLEAETPPLAPEAALEVFFDQSTVVADHAQAYWHEHVETREFASGEKDFIFKEHTFTDRQRILEDLKTQQIKAESELAAATDQPDQALQWRQTIVRIKEQRVQTILEQATADMAFLVDHRAQMYAEAKKLAEGADSQSDLTDLKKLAEKAHHLTTRMDKFSIYSKAAIILLEMYQDSADNLAENTGDQIRDRDKEFFYELLAATEKATNDSFSLTKTDDYDYLTTFRNLRESLINTKFKDLTVLLAARVKQLEATQTETESEEPASVASQAAQSDVDSTSTDLPQNPGAGFADLAMALAPEIDKTALQLDDSDQDGVKDTAEGSDGLQTTTLPPEASPKAAAEAREVTRSKNLMRAIEVVFNPKSGDDHATQVHDEPS